MSDVGLPEGVVLPEKEIEERRRLVKNVVVELNKPNNLDEFKNSVVAMFESFGMKHTTDPELLEDDNKRWAQYYEWRHTTPSLYSDIEFHGQPDPNHPKWVEYANIYINRLQVAGKEIPVSLVSAGACSLPMDDTKRYPDWSSRITHDFYRTFEEQIGVNEATYTAPHMKEWIKNVRQKTDNHFFAVVGEKSFLIPAKDWSIALASRLS